MAKLKNRLAAEEVRPMRDPEGQPFTLGYTLAQRRAGRGFR
jgi:hypothetical protein